MSSRNVDLPNRLTKRFKTPSKRCGADKLPAIFNALKREERKRRAPVSSEVKDAILDANARPKPLVTYTNWEKRYRQVAEENGLLKQELADKDKQIAKLQAALENAKGKGAYHHGVPCHGSARQPEARM